MAKEQYSNEQLFEIGKIHYEKLALHCQTLEVSGFWEQARQVMKQSGTEVLDVYLQSLLMQFGISCGNVSKSQLVFVQGVPISNPLDIGEETETDEGFARDVARVYQMPPILIQLCSLYDKERDDNMTEYFIDALLNIILCFSCLDNGNRGKASEFIKEYYNKVSHYIGGKSAAEHSRYLFIKLNDDCIQCNIEKKVPVKKAEQQDGGQGREAAQQDGGKGREDTQQDVEFLQENMQSGAEDCDSEECLHSWEEVDDEEIPEDWIEWVECEEGKNRDGQALEDKAGENGSDNGKNEQQDEPEADRIVQTGEEKKNTADGEMPAAVLSAEEAEEKTEAEKEAELAEQAKAQFLIVKKRIQEREHAEERAHEEKIRELMGELNSLVGLESVKQEIQSLINLIKIRKMRRQMQLPEMEMSYHMVFTGSPGTGKTTVARLVAKIYKELGILSEGNLVETDRSGLVAGYVGQTAIKVHEIVEQAIGGILFIDEAYSLANPEIQNDFGTEAVDALVKLMEDHRDNLVIIVAGYTEEMKSFLKSNTGLISRFNKFIDFPDYSRNELVSIMNVMAKNAGLQIEEEAQKKVLFMLEHKKEEEWKDFGNARGVRNLFERFIMNQANRLVMLQEPTREDLVTIRPEDVAV